MTIKILRARCRSRCCCLLRRCRRRVRTTFPRTSQAVAKAQITAGALEAPIRFLASDALEGRGPATRGDALARLYLAAELQSLGYLPGGEKGGWEQTVDVVGTTAQLPAVWSFTGQERQCRSQAVRRLHRRHRRADAERRHRRRRPRVRGLRHRSARVPVGRLQGRRREGQGARHAQQRSGLGSEVVCRQDAPVLRPLDLQIRKRRAPWRRGRHHRPHHAVGRVSLAGGAVVLGRRAVRTAGRRRAAHPAQGLGHRRCRAPPGEGRRAGSRQADRRREEPLVQAGAARAQDLHQVRQQGLARAHRERRRRAAGQRSRSSRTRSSSTRRTTTTSASASPTRPATRSTTAPRTTPRAARRCWPSRAPWPRCPSGRGAPSSCCSSPAKSRGC